MEGATEAPTVRWIKTGAKYMLGHTQEEPHCYGIWERGNGTNPTARFPFTEHGKNESMAAFLAMEPNAADVGLDGGVIASAVPRSPNRDAWAFSTPTPVSSPRGSQAGLTKPPGSGTAVTSLVLGILGVLIPLFLSVPAIVFGGIGISNANSKGSSGKGMAIAGLVLGIIGTLIGLAMLGNLGDSSGSSFTSVG